MQPKPIADQLRETITNSGQSLYRIAVGSGVLYPSLYRFMRYDCEGLGLKTVDKLFAYFGFQVIPPKDR